MVSTELTPQTGQIQEGETGSETPVREPDGKARQRPPIGELLKDLRGAKTLRQVEADTGITNAYLSNIELGLKRPGMKTLSKLGIYHRVPLERLLRVAGLEAEAPQPGRQVSDVDIQRAYEFVLGDPSISRFERPKELPCIDMQRFVIGMYEHYTGRRLL